MTKEEILKFLDGSSVTGLLILYACKISFDKKTAFSFKKMIYSIYEENEYQEGYSYGFLVACAAFDVIDFTLSKDIITVSSINIDISEGINNELQIREKLEEENSKESVKYFKKTIKVIEDYFND